MRESNLGVTSLPMRIAGRGVCYSASYAILRSLQPVQHHQAASRVATHGVTGVHAEIQQHLLQLVQPSQLRRRGWNEASTISVSPSILIDRDLGTHNMLNERIPG